MKTDTTLALIIAVLSLLSIVLLAYPPHSGAVVSCHEQMVISGGGSYVARCMGPIKSEVPYAFLRRQEGDYRRMAIAQRNWDYDAPRYPDLPENMQ